MSRTFGVACATPGRNKRKSSSLSISKKRGSEGMDDAGLLPQCSGMLTHDCWSPYWHYSEFTHNVCRAHLLRELQNVMDNHPEQTWARRFSDLLISMKKAQEKALRSGKEKLSFSTSYRFGHNYDEIIAKAYEENPEPEATEGKHKGRPKRGKVLALIDRLKKYKESICLIMSCVSTGRKHGHNGYNVIMNLIHGSLEFMTAV